MPANPPDPAYSLPARGIGFVVPAVIWAVWFAASYSLQGAGCSAGLQRLDFAGVGLLTLLLAALLLLALAGNAWLAYRAQRDMRRLPREEKEDTSGHPSRFFVKLTLLSSGLFLVAVLWVGYPVILLDPCTGRLPHP